MNFNLSEVPFSRRGSYLAISRLADHSNKVSSKKLCLRTIHGLSYIPGRKREIEKSTVFQMIPLYNGNAVAYSTQAEPYELQLKTNFGTISICYADNDTVLFRGEGKGLGLRLIFENNAYIYEAFADHKEIYCTCAALGCRFRTSALSGKMEFSQSWNGANAESCFVDISSDQTCFLAAFQNMAVERQQPFSQYDYVFCKEQVKKDFEDFLTKMPSVPSQYSQERELAAYVIWASIVQPSGIITREAMLMSKNWMCNVWSWDHCFNAIALSYHHPDLAWDQFMLMFDFQDETGVIPDCINDVYASYAFVKPPIHGWALSKIMKNMELSQEQLKEAYVKLSAWTNWWLKYRDHDQDGLCEYFHGNDSGWDNSTAFISSPAVELPDLAAFLIIQMKVLGTLCQKLGDQAQALTWNQKADSMLNTMLSCCFKDGKPIARTAYTHQTVSNDSLILYLPVILGDLLPENILNGLIKVLKSSRFYTDYGFATESPQSQFYQSDGYWRGPIWAPSSMIIIDGLDRSNEKRLAFEAARRFAEIISKSGFAENFDALTGEGLRDRAYTWTASTFLILAHEYLTEYQSD